MECAIPQLHQDRRSVLLAYSALLACADELQIPQALAADISKVMGSYKRGVPLACIVASCVVFPSVWACVNATPLVPLLLMLLTGVCSWFNR